MLAAPIPRSTHATHGSLPRSAKPGARLLPPTASHRDRCSVRCGGSGAFWRGNRRGSLQDRVAPPGFAPGRAPTPPDVRFSASGGWKRAGFNPQDRVSCIADLFPGAACFVGVPLPSPLEMAAPSRRFGFGQRVVIAHYGLLTFGLVCPASRAPWSLCSRSFGPSLRHAFAWPQRYYGLC